MTITMTCPNEECERAYDVEVTVTGHSRRATYWEPAEEPEVEVCGPVECDGCGTILDTPRAYEEAYERAREQAADAAMEYRLENRRR